MLVWIHGWGTCGYRGLIVHGKWGMKALIRYWGGGILSDLTWLQAGCLRLQQQGSKSKPDQEEGLEEPESSLAKRESSLTLHCLVTQQLLTSSKLGTGISGFWFFLFFFFKWRMRVLCNHSAWDAYGWSRYKTQCLFISWKDWRTDSGQPGTGEFRGEAIWGCSYKSFNRIRVFESGRDLGVKELHVQSSANSTRAFLPLRMWSSTWLKGHRGTELKTVIKWFF